MNITGKALPLPGAMPQMPQTAVRRLVAALLHRCGWQMRGQFPDLPKLVMIAAPHSSWWDGVWGMLFKIALGADLTFMGKRELFHGPLGWILRRLGGIPIHRTGAHGLVEQMATRFHDSRQLWLGLAPEGTRKPVREWRTGFWHIARAAGVPILPIAFDYPSRSIVIGQPFQPSADLAADLVELHAFYAPFRGKDGRGAVAD